MNRFLIHLRSHTGQWIALIAASLMLVAFFGLQPWAAVRLPAAATPTASTGAQAPAGRIAIPTADANGMITVPDGIQLPPFLPTPNADGQIPASSLPNLAGGNAAAAGAPPGAQAPTSGTTRCPGSDQRDDPGSNQTRGPLAGWYSAGYVDHFHQSDGAAGALGCHRRAAGHTDQLP